VKRLNYSNRRRALARARADEKNMRLALKTTTMAEPSEPIAARFLHGKGLAVPKPSENRDWFAVDCFLQHGVRCEPDFRGFRITGRSLPDRIGWNLSESNQSQASRNDQAGTTGELNYNGYCNPEVDKLIDRQSVEADQERRKQLVLEIERKLAEDGARPIVFYDRRATCWQPWAKGLTIMVNSISNGARMEDVWPDN
jgi:hypothetical protein